MQSRKNIPQLSNMLAVRAAQVVLLKEAFQALMADGSYHSEP
jgi:hypothetical protein